jgi:hypothetical protein
MTPRRTVAVGLLTLVAVAVTTIAAAAITGNGQSLYGHPFWHLLWGVLTVPIALGILLVRRAWAATGWTERSLVAAVVFALTSAAGNVLAGIGVLPEYQASSLYGHPLWQFSWAGPILAIALGILLVRSAWPATVWVGRWLIVALAVALVCAAGNVLVVIGVLPPDYAPSQTWPTTKGFCSFHTVGENLGVGSLLILLPVCLVMVGVGVQGAIRPTTAQRAEARAVR